MLESLLRILRININISFIPNNNFLVSNGVELRALGRSKVDNEYLNLMMKAREIEMIAFTGETFTESFRKIHEEEDYKINKFIQRIINRECEKIEILLLDPDNLEKEDCIWKDRSDKDGRSLEEFRAKCTEVENYWKVKFKESFDKRKRKTNNNNTGNFLIKYYNCFPNYAYFRADNTIIIGIYLHSKSGFNSPVLKINNQEMINKLKEDFTRFSEAANKTDKHLIKIIGH